MSIGSTSFLKPILEKMPKPPNTKIEAKCFMCKHFDICNLRDDYLKTAILIQRVLGDPDENYELNGKPPLIIPDFIGIPIYDGKTLFAAEINAVVCEEDVVGEFYQAKFDTLDNVRLVYTFGEYYTMLTYSYDKDNEVYELVSFQEVFYKVDYTLGDISAATLKKELSVWRSSEEENPTPAPEVINTTAFSSKLDCDYYDWIKGLDYRSALLRIAEKYPNGIPLGNEKYYHIATYHCEPEGVASYKPSGVSYLPLPYPVFIPPKKKCDCHPPIRRGDR